MNIDHFISTRIRDLRKSRDLTLEQLAERSGVSRSMISLIERRATSPTAVVLNKLADALDVSLPGLFSQDNESVEHSPVSRFDTQTQWTDPASGYVRRHLSPVGTDSPIEMVEVTFPAGQSVTFNNPARGVVIHQQIWILEGRMDITVGDEYWHLESGDCLAVKLGERIVFRNPTKRQARYLLALTTTATNSRRSF